METFTKFTSNRVTRVYSRVLKVQPITGHEGAEGEQMYSSTLSLTLALDGVVGQRQAPAALYPRKDSVLIV